jgi:hypothetical protein
MTTRATAIGASAFTFALRRCVCTADGMLIFRFKIDVKPASDGLRWDYREDARVNIVSVVSCRRAGIPRY